jgi:hypothetical protein
MTSTVTKMNEMIAHFTNYALENMPWTCTLPRTATQLPANSDGKLYVMLQVLAGLVACQPLMNMRTVENFKWPSCETGNYGLFQH